MKARTIRFGVLLIAMILPTTLSSTATQEQRIKFALKSLSGSRPEIYKKIGDVALPIYIFVPRNHQSQDKCPAIVFFFGGGWRGGSSQQFQNQCQYLASRGMVASRTAFSIMGGRTINTLSTRSRRWMPSWFRSAI